jgi:hypothetical protein
LSITVVNIVSVASNVPRPQTPLLAGGAALAGAAGGLAIGAMRSIDPLDRVEDAIRECGRGPSTAER